MANFLDGVEGGKHNSDNSEVTIEPSTFTVSVKFTDMVAKNPLEAAKTAYKWLKDDARNMIYEVIVEDTLVEHEIDLSEVDNVD